MVLRRITLWVLQFNSLTFFSDKSFPTPHPPTSNERSYKTLEWLLLELKKSKLIQRLRDGLWVLPCTTHVPPAAELKLSFPYMLGVMEANRSQPSPSPGLGLGWRDMLCPRSCPFPRSSSHPMSGCCGSIRAQSSRSNLERLRSVLLSSECPLGLAESFAVTTVHVSFSLGSLLLVPESTP